MRDSQRIGRLLMKLKQVWYACPDQRLGQLMANLLGDNAHIPEDETLEEILDAIIKADFHISIGIALRDHLIPQRKHCRPGDICSRWPVCESCGLTRL